MRMAKQVALPADLGPAGALTTESLRRIRAQCQQQWAAMGAEQKEQYKALYHGRLAERRAAAVAAESRRPVGERTAPLAGHWKCGADRFVIHPKFLQEAFAAGARLPQRDEVLGA